jgi:type IX secretion system PorP/SprF family membrane protein
MRVQLKAYILIISVVLPGFNLTINAQNFHYSNQHENLFKSNPASISRVERIAFQLTYRNQWPGNSDFVTYDGAFILSSARLKSSLGIHIYRDSQGSGIISLTGGSLLYAYRTQFRRDWYFSAGIMASFSQYHAGFSGLDYEDPGLGIPPDENFLYFDFSTGTELQYRDRHWFGLSLTHLGAFQNTMAGTLNTGISLSYRGRYPYNTGSRRFYSYLEPLFCTTINLDYSEILYGARIHYQSVYGGIYFRQNHLFQFDAAIILLGTRFENAELFYTYDINLSGVNSMFTNLAAHEVTFLYNMQYNKKTIRKSRKHRAIKCPKI